MTAFNPDPPPPAFTVKQSVMTRVDNSLQRMYPVVLEYDDEVVMTVCYVPDATIAWDIVEAMTKAEALLP